MSEKKNIPLIISLSIPVVMLLLVAGSIYLPVMLIKPMTDFVYSIESGHYYCREFTFDVRMGRVTRNEVDQQQKKDQNPNYCQNRQDARLFYYDVKKDSAREISLAQATQLILDDQRFSEDGFEIVQGSGGSDFLYFGGRDYCSRFIKKGLFNRRINAPLGERYSHHFTFLGWVKGGVPHG